MCLSAASFGLLLSIFPLSDIAVDEGRITVQTRQANFVWLQVGTRWCAVRPGTERWSSRAKQVALV